MVRQVGTDTAIEIALRLKAALPALAMAGPATLRMAGFGDKGASLIVVGNGLRARCAGAPVTPCPGADGRTASTRG